MGIKLILSEVKSPNILVWGSTWIARYLTLVRRDDSADNSMDLFWMIFFKSH